MWLSYTSTLFLLDHDLGEKGICSLLVICEHQVRQMTTLEYGRFTIDVMTHFNFDLASNIYIQTKGKRGSLETIL